jgi:hypothetical protein
MQAYTYWARTRSACVSVVTVRGSDTVNIVQNPRTGAFRVVHCDEVAAGGTPGYRVSLQRAGS